MKSMLDLPALKLCHMPVHTHTHITHTHTLHDDVGHADNNDVDIGCMG